MVSNVTSKQTSIKSGATGASEANLSGGMVVQESP
jgi:hypothetical protein